MKILNLYFKNINSLEGESRIDFQQEPLAHAGVFAIVGPNGSGKSSILDAISLAFYGETFRFDRPAEQVMTINASESFSQVDFALGNKKFRTAWHVKRPENPDNNAIPEMRLSTFTENGTEILEQTTQGVCNKIKEIIGMDFRNFSRSIMLAQGDFAAFLHALDSERMDILEKMSSEDIYERHQQLLSVAKNQAEMQLENTQQALASLPLLDKITLVARLEDLADFQTQLTDFQQQQIILDEQLVSRKKVNSLENQIANLSQQQQQNQQQLLQTQENLAQIATLQTALVFKEDIVAIQQLEKQLTDNQQRLQTDSRETEKLQQQLIEAGLSALSLTENQPKNLAEQRQILHQAQENLSQLEDELTAQTNLQQVLNRQIAEKQAIQQNTVRWLETHSQEKNLLEQFPDTVKLAALRAELTQLANQQTRLFKQVSVLEQEQQKNQILVDLAKKKVAQYTQDLADTETELAKLTTQHSAAEIEFLVIEQQHRVADFNELYSLAKVHQKIHNPGLLGFFQKKEAVKIVRDIQELKIEAAEIAEEIAQAQNIKTVLEQAVLNEVLIQRLRFERPHLVSGKPCPLCGALQHPFAKLPPKEAHSKQALVNQKIRLQELMVKSESIARQIAVAQKNSDDEQNKTVNLQKITAEFITLSNKLNIAQLEHSITQVNALKNLLKQEQNELSNLQTLLKRYRIQQDNVSRLQLHLTNEQSKLTQLETTQQQLTQNIGQLPQELHDMRTAMSRLQAEELALSTEINQQLTLLGEAIPEKGKEEELFERLQQRMQEYQTYSLRYKVLEEELAVLQEKSTVNLQKIEQNQQAIADLSGSLHTEEAVGLQLAFLEKQQVQQQQSQLCAAQLQQLTDLQQLFSEKLRDTPFASMAQVLDALTLIETQTGLAQQQTNLTAQQQQLAQALLTTQNQLSALQTTLTVAETEEELVAQQRALREKSEIAQAEIQRLEKQQRDQGSLQTQQQQLSAALVQQQQLFAQASEELRLSEANSLAFRREVQLKMIAQLLTHTNKMLEKMSGRYYVRQVPTPQGLALAIEDTFQPSILRLPHSLSGGESFVISLALALGLSALANNGKTVDSLFLDEGFGHLDADSLYMVISTLQNLQTHGKTVGVISHVESVKKRIKIRIEMVKKSNGLSQLKKVS